MQSSNLKNISKYFLIIFGIVLIGFVLFSVQTTFHDTSEYISVSKYLSGIKNVDIFSTHSLLYPAIISVFLEIWPSFITIKLINCLWLFLISLILFFWLKNYKAFILFVFSPLVWIVSIQTTPILPASFFFLLAWIFLKKININYNLLYSGLFLGLSCAIYDVMFLIAFVFIIVYFFNKRIWELLLYLIFVFIGFFPRFIFDFFIFNMPFYSLIRFFGANIIFSLGLSNYSNFQILTNLKWLAILIVISPFLFKIYKTANKNKQDLIFLGVSFIILLVRTATLKYFLIIAPIIIIYLSKYMSNKEIKWHCIISVVLIVFFTWGYFNLGQDSLVKSDINKIIEEYNPDYIISGPFEADYISTFLWKENPKIIWFEDYQASLENKTVIRKYDFEFNSDKIKLRDKLVISGGFERIDDIIYEEGIIVSKNENLEGFKLDKCYEILCVYNIK